MEAKQITINKVIPTDIDQAIGLIEDLKSVEPNFRQSVDIVIKEWKENAEKDLTRCFFAFDSEENLLGIACNRPEESAINFLHVKTEIMEENPEYAISILNKLFDTAFNDIKTNRLSTTLSKNVAIFIPVKDYLKPIVENAGFEVRTRSRRKISKETIEKLPKLELPNTEYEYAAWDEDNFEEYVDIIVSAHKGTADEKLLSHFFGNKPGMRTLLGRVQKNSHGSFNNRDAIVLLHNKKPIGLCIVTKFEKTKIGYIPDIALRPAYKGKGLGKGMMIYSLKNYIANNEDSKSVELDITHKVTNAYELYKKLGFEEIRTYDMYYYWLLNE